MQIPAFNPPELTGSHKTIAGFDLICRFDRVAHFRGIMERLPTGESGGDLTAVSTKKFLKRIIDLTNQK